MMARHHGRIFVAALVVVAGGFTASSMAFALRARADEGAGIIERSRHTTMKQPLTGTVEVAWSDGTTMRTTRTAIVGDGTRLYAGSVAAGETGYQDDQMSLAMPASDPQGGAWPSPTVKYDLVAVAGTPVAGRPTDGVEARLDGTVRERWLVDTATGVLLQREIFAGDGTLARRITTVQISMAGPTTPPSTAVPGAAVQGKRMQQLSSPFLAPRTIGAGYDIVGTYELNRDARQAFYSDGLRDLSVFQQRGDLMWDDLPAGGTDTTINGVRVRTYASPIGCTWIWERNGMVFTAVSDTTPDEMAAVVTGLKPPKPSGWDRFRHWVRSWFD